MKTQKEDWTLSVIALLLCALFCLGVLFGQIIGHPNKIQNEQNNLVTDEDESGEDSTGGDTEDDTGEVNCQ